MAVWLPRPILRNVREAEAKGHRLTSQGCSLFRCVYCNDTQFLGVGEPPAGTMAKPCSKSPAKPEKSMWR